MESRIVILDPFDEAPSQGQFIGVGPAAGTFGDHLPVETGTEASERQLRDRLGDIQLDEPPRGGPDPAVPGQDVDVTEPQFLAVGGHRRGAAEIRVEADQPRGQMTGLVRFERGVELTGRGDRPEPTPETSAAAQPSTAEPAATEPAAAQAAATQST